MSRYNISDGFVTHCDGRAVCGNRPIYCANTYTSILAGDLPVIRLTNHTKIFGALYFYIKTKQNEKVYLHEFTDINFFYKPNIVKWVLSDSRVNGTITATVGAPENAEGYILKLETTEEIKLYFSYRDFLKLPPQTGAGEKGWNLTVILNPELKEPFLDYESETVSFSCEKNCAEISALGEKVFFRAPDGIEVKSEKNGLSGEFKASREPVFFSVMLNCSKIYPFSSVIERSERLNSRFNSETPDKMLDTALRCTAAEIDGAWKPPLTDHGNSAYSEPLLGWCNRFGNALGGWYDRCLEELKYFAARQSKSDKKKDFSFNKNHLETIAGHNSRFYGLGHIGKYQHMYNMQSQFFDQMIFAYRMSGNEKMGKILYKALKLHTRWQDECFDPDGDGLYESYINNWATDSVWYNGGGSCEETCYAYRSHSAAAELAEKYGETDELNYHKAAVNRIENGFNNLLWLKNDGYPAMLRENGFYNRLHKSAWLYNCFLPVDTGLTDLLHSASCLWYSKWGLENVRPELGGRMVWMSNWVPSVWSVRKLMCGENFQLAYAFFKAGFAEEGYDLLVGASLKGSFDGIIPAEICSEAASLMARAFICGMHGYEPDYPNGNVIISPHYPTEWKTADINTEYFKAKYRKSDKGLEYSFSLAAEANVTLNLQLPVSEIISVKGVSKYSILPGFSSITVSCEMGLVTDGKITVEIDKPIDMETEITVNAAPAETVSVAVPYITELTDIQGVIEKSDIENGTVRLKTANISGTHIVFAVCKYAGNKYYRLIRLTLSETAEEKERKDRAAVDTAGADFEMLSVSEQHNGAVQKIFKQKYRSPFKGINRLSIGTDGYSPWTFTFWGSKPPEISLMPELEVRNTVYSDNGIPFRWQGGKRNVAFTSLWDNWPSEISFSVNKTAQAIHFLIVGSTNPMQCGIANAELELHYASGKTESIDLINPENFWSVCGYKGAGEVSDQTGADDYSYETDAFCLPKIPPKQILLGNNCRACVLSYKTLPETIESISLRTLSQEVVIGLCAITIQK